MLKFDFINVIIENSILLFYCYTVFNSKRLPKVLNVFAVVFLIGITFSASMLHLPTYVNLTVSFIMSLSVICVMFEGTLKKKFFMTVIYMVVIFFSDILATIVITLFGISYNMSGSDNITFIVGAMLSDFIRLWLLAYVGKVLSKRVQNLPASYWIFFFVCPLLSVLCMVIFDVYLMQADNVNPLLVFIPPFSILYINFMVFRFFEVFSDWIKLKVSEKLTQQREENYKILQSNENELRALRHDMKNHIMVMNEYLKNNDAETAKEHLKAIQGTLESISSVVNTGNSALDATINIGAKKAQALNIKYKTQISGSENINIDPADICSLLSNLIDNAIEGCLGSENKYVYIEISVSDMGFKIHIENTTKLNNCDCLDVSSKADKRNHGFGLKNVRSIVKKYNGIAKLEVKNGIFNVDIILKNISGNVVQEEKVLFGKNY